MFKYRRNCKREKLLLVKATHPLLAFLRLAPAEVMGYSCFLPKQDLRDLSPGQRGWN